MSGRQGFIKSVCFFERNKRNAIIFRLIPVFMFFLVHSEHEPSHSLSHICYINILEGLCGLYAP